MHPRSVCLFSCYFKKKHLLWHEIVIDIFLYVTINPLNVAIFILLYEKAKSQSFDDRKLTFKFKNLIFS